MFSALPSDNARPAVDPHRHDRFVIREDDARSETEMPLNDGKSSADSDKSRSEPESAYALQ